MNTLLRLCAVACASISTASLMEADNPPPKPPRPATAVPPKPAAPTTVPRSKPAPAAKTRPPRAFLGVSVSSLHPAVAANLPGLPNAGQGLVVEWVAADSPASKVGIKAPDILLVYDDQKLFSGEQFAKLIHSDRPQHEVTLQLFRDGKIQTLHATLAEAPARPSFGMSPFEGPMSRPGGPMMPMRPPMRPEPPLGTAWETFSSLCVKGVAENKFRTEVEYMPTAGKSRKYTFEGSPEEIRKAIESQKDLTAKEHYHLLHALNLHRMIDDYQPPSL